MILELFGATQENAYFAIRAALFALALLPMFGISATVALGWFFGLPIYTTAIISVLGNFAPVPIVIIFVRSALDWMRRKSVRLGKIADKLEQRAKNRSSRLERGEFIGLMIYVAAPIPFIPGTGAWTGSLIAGVFGMRLKTAISAIGIGVVIGTIIMTIATYGVLGWIFG